MTIPIRMPELAETMTHGTLVSWATRAGDEVSKGQVLTEIETDKSLVDLAAPAAGIIEQILVPAGSENVAVGAILATLGESDVPTILSKTVQNSVEPLDRPEPSLVTGGEEATPILREVPSQSPLSKVSSMSQPDVTPLGLSMAVQAGLDLNALAASGTHERLGKREIEAALPVSASRIPTALKFPATLTNTRNTVSAGGCDAPITGLRRAIANRLTESKRQVPHFYVRRDCEVDALQQLRRELNCHSDGYRLSLNDFLVRAAGLALIRVPTVNASWREKAIRVHGQADVSIAVGTDRGLYTPVIRDADRKGLAVISNEIRLLVAQARAAKLSPASCEGGSLTISNLGMCGVESLDPIINPPQSCILGIGAAAERPVVRDGQIVIATVMCCTLSADHRVIDGVDAAKFLVAFTALLENPITMLL